MKFYTKQHEHYCGIDLHTKKMYLCIINQQEKVVLHKNIDTNPDIFMSTIQPFRKDLVVGVECMFTWYWIADLCKRAELLAHIINTGSQYNSQEKTQQRTSSFNNCPQTRTSSLFYAKKQTVNPQ